MTLETAILVLVLTLMGIVLARRYLRKKRTVYIFCMAVLLLLALACSIYIGLTLIFVNAVGNQMPAP